VTRDEHVRDEELDELLGAYALDAVDELERRRVESYLAANPEARAEVWEMRQAAAMLAHSGDRAPEEVWDRIAGALEEQPPRFAGRLDVPARSWRRPWIAAVAAAAAVALVAGGVVTALVLSDGSGDPQAAEAIADAYEAARDDPASREVELVSEGATLRVAAVVAADGQGFLAAGELPELAEDETYQLWGVYGDGDVISLGVVGNRPGIEPFAAAGELDALAITREVAGGVVSSVNDPILLGTFET
jgi:anti-sigma-K factor RskA